MPSPPVHRGARGGRPTIDLWRPAFVKVFPQIVKRDLEKDHLSVWSIAVNRETNANTTAPSPQRYGLRTFIRHSTIWCDCNTTPAMSHCCRVSRCIACSADGTHHDCAGGG